MRGMISKSDPTLYSLKRYACFVSTLVYIDDILMFWEMKQEIDFVIGQFKEKFEICVTRTIAKFLILTFDDSGDTI